MSKSTLKRKNLLPKDKFFVLSVHFFLEGVFVHWKQNVVTIFFKILHTHIFMFLSNALSLYSIKYSCNIFI